ncbi:hypothetical protein AB3S75_045645 [Citrus x aurantiifolia]
MNYMLFVRKWMRSARIGHGTNAHSASTVFVNTSDTRRIDVPKPDTYDDTHNTTIVDNFLFELDQYFNAMGVRDEASKLGITPIYL